MKWPTVWEFAGVFLTTGFGLLALAGQIEIDIEISKSLPEHIVYYAVALAIAVIIALRLYTHLTFKKLAESFPNHILSAEHKLIFKNDPSNDNAPRGSMTKTSLIKSLDGACSFTGRHDINDPPPDLTNYSIRDIQSYKASARYTGKNGAPIPLHETKFTPSSFRTVSVKNESKTKIPRGKVFELIETYEYPDDQYCFKDEYYQMSYSSIYKKHGFVIEFHNIKPDHAKVALHRGKSVAPIKEIPITIEELGSNIYRISYINKAPRVGDRLVIHWSWNY